jgi:YegS/Rv2252/BmrU family lipid kinase
MKSSVFLIANPAARTASGKKIKLASEIIEKKGFKADVLLTEKAGDGIALAKEALKRGASLVIAGGGDGTFNEVANGLAGTDTPMALLPMGTTNVLAKELNLPEDVRGAVETALSGRIHHVSLGKISYNSSSRLFFLMAGIGFDAGAVYGVHKKFKKYSGKGAYILSGLKSLLSWNPEKLSVEIDGEAYEGYSVIVCKGSKYGGHFRAAPDARLTEPALYAVLMKGKRRTDFVRYALGVLTRRHVRMKDVLYKKCMNVKVSGDARMQVDGDYLGKTPAEIIVVPDALKLVY